MAIYDRYASIYDGSGQIRFALLVASYLNDLLAHHPVPGRQALDLACGTGTLALLLAGEGWQVVGVDRSPAMLAQARMKVHGARCPGSVHFVEADMRQLDGVVARSSFDLALCTYDSLNYLLNEADLAACFKGIAAALVPGGLFVADMNTPYFLAHEWEACLVREQPGAVQIERSYFDPAHCQVTLVLSGFLGDDDAGYERFDEVHHERAYPAASVRALLEQAGLCVEGEYDSFTLQPPGSQAHRIFWLARKV